MLSQIADAHTVLIFAHELAWLLLKCLCDRFAGVLQPLPAMSSALASRTVSWNPVSFAQAAAEVESGTDPTLSRTATTHSRNSAADYASGIAQHHSCAFLFVHSCCILNC